MLSSQYIIQRVDKAHNRLDYLSDQSEQITFSERRHINHLTNSVIWNYQNSEKLKVFFGFFFFTLDECKPYVLLTFKIAQYDLKKNVFLASFKYTSGNNHSSHIYRSKPNIAHVLMTLQYYTPPHSIKDTVVRLNGKNVFVFCIMIKKVCGKGFLFTEDRKTV